MWVQALHGPPNIRVLSLIGQNIRFAAEKDRIIADRIHEFKGKNKMSNDHEWEYTEKTQYWEYWCCKKCKSIKKRSNNNQYEVVSSYVKTETNRPRYYCFTIEDWKPYEKEFGCAEIMMKIALR